MSSTTAGVTVPVLKFVGTCSLGLLTGVSYTTSTQSLPSFFGLPSAGVANATFKQHQAATTRHLNALATLASSTYLLAFALSPGKRHPYLLWTFLAVGIGAGTDLLMAKRDSDTRKREQGSTEKVDEEDYEDVNGSVRLNGEEVRKSMECYKLRQSVRAGISGFAFLLGVVGLWGDGRPAVGR